MLAKHQIPTFIAMPEEPDPFSILQPLPHEVTLFVPSTRDGNIPDPELQQVVLNYVNEYLSAAYGGTTEWPSCNGHWVSDTLGLVTEQVTPVTCYVADLTYEAKAKLIELGRFILTTMRQEAVLLVVDGKGGLLTV